MMDIKAIFMEHGWSEGASQLFAEHADDEATLRLLKKWGQRVDTPKKKPTPKQAIPAHIRWKIWEKDNFTCKRCGKRQYLEVDHIHPESKGGTLDEENLQTLCKKCNSSKGNR